MGRHTAPIPIIRPAAAEPQPVGPITDPRLFDRPLPPARQPGTAVRPPIATPPTTRRPARAPVARVPARLRAPEPAALTPDTDDDGIDETPVDVLPRTVQSVLEAEEAAAAEELPPPRLPRARDLLFAGAALAVLAVAVGAAVLP